MTGFTHLAAQSVHAAMDKYDYRSWPRHLCIPCRRRVEVEACVIGATLRVHLVV